MSPDVTHVPWGTESPLIFINAVIVLSGLTSEPPHDPKRDERHREDPPAPEFSGSQILKGDWPVFSLCLRWSGKLGCWKEKEVRGREVSPGARQGNREGWNRDPFCSGGQ